MSLFVWVAAAWFGLGASEASAAEPVFVPDFTPVTSDEFAVSVMLQGMVVDQLLRDGDVVLTNAVVAPVLGGAALAGCALRPDCPNDLLPKLPTRIAVVAKVERIGGQLVGNVYLYEVGVQNPVDSLYVPVASGNEHLFAADVSRAVQTLLTRIGPSPEEVLVAAARLIAGQPATTGASPLATPGGAPAPAPAPTTAPAAAPGPPVVPHRYDGSTPHEGDLGPILDGTGITRRHLIGSEGSFRKSGLDPRDWVYRATPHAGRIEVELRAGVGLGDVDRVATVRVETTGGDQTNGWFQEGPVAGRRVRGDLYVGYAPATMVDIGLLAGLQYGHRVLSTGIVILDNAGVVVDEQVANGGDIQAVNLYLQPRVRAYLVPLGPAKPFLFTGADIRIFDRYHIDQPVTVTYPAPPGGVIPGWVGGGGMMIDPGPIVGFFAEGMVIRHFGELASVRTTSLAGPWAHEFDAIAPTTQITVGITGGVQFRL